MGDVQTQTIVVKIKLLSFNLHYYHCPVIVGFFDEKTLDFANLSISTIAIVGFSFNFVCCPNQGVVFHNAKFWSKFPLEQSTNVTIT